MKNTQKKYKDSVSDIELFAGIDQQQAQAFSAIYDRHSARLYGLALKILKDPVLAQDVLQDVFVYIWQNAHNFNEQRGTPLAWMMILCRNRSIDKLRVDQNRIKRTVAIDAEYTKNLGSDESESPLQVVHLSEVRDTVTTALAQLPTEQRVPIEMAYFEGLSQTEISETLETPLGTIKTRIRLGMQKLRNFLK